jgi:hypothetical protein
VRLGLILFVKHNWNDETKECEIGRACRPHEGEEHQKGDQQKDIDAVIVI